MHFYLKLIQSFFDFNFRQRILLFRYFSEISLRCTLGHIDSITALHKKALFTFSLI